MPGNGDSPGGICPIYEECTDDSRDGGGGPGNNGQPNLDILNELNDYPCAQNLVLQLPNLNNDIAISLKTIFENNENYNIVFRPKSGLGNIDGTTHSSSSNTGGLGL